MSGSATAQTVSIGPWTLAAREDLNRGTVLRAEAVEGLNLETRIGTQSLWMVARLRGGGAFAFRLAYSPGELHLDQSPARGVLGSYRLRNALGLIEVEVSAPPESGVVRYRTALTPDAALKLPYWPRDVVVLGRNDDPLEAKGEVHVSQRGAKSPVLLAAMEAPSEATLLYVQHLTSLNEYFETVEAKPDASVGGEWPELGFALPAATEKPLPAGRRLVVSDAMVRIAPKRPTNGRQAGALYLDLLGDIYPHLDRPRTAYRDWLSRAEACLRDVDGCKGCWTQRRGRRYLNGFAFRPEVPESTVQLTMLVPLIEHEKQHGRRHKLRDELQRLLPDFWRSDLNTVVRYLPGESFDDDAVQETSHERIDAWYLYHTLHNLARVARETGDETARQMFLDSLDYAIRVARHFDYRWPIFFDLYTLETTKVEGPEVDGEPCTAGLYAMVMLFARDFTGDSRYFEEAKRAARVLEDYGFNLLYQVNNTNTSALAMLQMYRETGEELYRELCLLCLANVFANIYLWDCDYGAAKHYQTFLGIGPMLDADYFALFEESECLATFDRLMAVGGEDLPASVRMLMAEYHKHLLHRAWKQFPCELPKDILATEHEYGKIDADLLVPLEDLGEGWTAPGSVGQQVYGAGGAVTLATYAYRGVSELGAVIYCDYPVARIEVDDAERAAAVTLRGDPRMRAMLRVLPGEGGVMPRLEVEPGEAVLGVRTAEDGCLEIEAAGGGMVRLRRR